MARHRVEPEPAAARPAPRGVGLPLYIVVFVCGAVLMAFEMVGSRILAPTFGSTIFVWGSLIGVFLAALSLGYYVGGGLADRWPKFSLLGAIIAAAGLLVLVVPLIAPPCNHWIDRMSPGGRANPLLASMLLFFVPSVLLGMVSPYAVRLQAQSVATTGSVAGRLYALSTLGSIAGTLAATFWLVPTYWTSNTVKALGVCLVLVSLIALVPSLVRRGARASVAGLLAVAALLAGAAGLAAAKPPSYIRLEEGEKLVAEVDSPYQHIGVVLLSRGYGDQDKQWSLRMMFDKYIESEVMVQSGDPSDIRLKEPYESGAKYTDTLHLPFLFNKDARRVLIVGGGGGVVPTIFRRDYPQLEAIDVVEIDPTVVEVAEKYFGFRPGQNGVNTHVMDGRVYVRECPQQYDIILLDAFTGGRPPFHLLTTQFLTLVKARLGPRGVAHMNIISALEGEKSKLFWAMLKTFHHVFGPEHVYVFPKLYDPRWGQTRSRTDGMNIELVALNFEDFQNPLPKAIIEARARERVGTLIKIPSITRHAENHMTMDDLLCVRDPSEQRRAARQAEWRSAPLMTDDYAPVDNWVTD
ncbi:MAG TPA: fused MFS/spermidine synthase [Planctomycetota bacterium]|nr:fused MFS/spermidine synthase [Planctomycetota bacterium]HRR83102.1 fused MFS/spermidine synthase [Planctomycetota bacterium]HRT94608.1 fused MFS/spermidine synthase [Planctomycetota bacterium]